MPVTGSLKYKLLSPYLVSKGNSKFSLYNGVTEVNM